MCRIEGTFSLDTVSQKNENRRHGFIKFLHINNVLYEAAYAPLLPYHRLKRYSIFKVTRIVSTIPKKTNLAVQCWTFSLRCISMSVKRFHVLATYSSRRLNNYLHYFNQIIYMNKMTLVPSNCTMMRAGVGLKTARSSICLEVTPDCNSSLYSRTSMAQTSWLHWKFVLDIGSSGNWGLIIASGQEAYEDNFGMVFFVLIRIVLMRRF